jgi:hypothetical protein
MRKQSVSAPAMFKNWRERYIVLSAATRDVQWYKTADAPTPNGRLALDGGGRRPRVFTSKPQLRWSGASTGYAQLRTTKPVAKLHICVGERELVLEAEAKEVDEWKKAVLAVIAEITAERGRGPGMGPLHTHGSGGGLSTAAL